MRMFLAALLLAFVVFFSSIELSLQAGRYFGLSGSSSSSKQRRTKSGKSGADSGVPSSVDRRVSEALKEDERSEANQRVNSTPDPYFHTYQRRESYEPHPNQQHYNQQQYNQQQYNQQQYNQQQYNQPQYNQPTQTIQSTNSPPVIPYPQWLLYPPSPSPVHSPAHGNSARSSTDSNADPHTLDLNKRPY